MFYLEFECVRYKLRDTEMIQGFENCRRIVTAARKKFMTKKRSPGRGTKISCLRVVNGDHRTVYEVKM